MLTPPYTGNNDLDAFLYQLQLNGVDNASTDISSNTTTGEITDSSNNVIGYLYPFIQVKYADSNIGTGLSNSPTNKSYYGIYNSVTDIESTNPANYTWYKVTGTFGTTRFLYYYVLGGRQIKFDVNTAPIDYRWLLDSGAAINLDLLVPPKTITPSELMDAAVTELKIADAAVTASKTNIAAISATTGNLVANSVGLDQIQNQIIDSTKLVDQAITEAKLATNSVTTTKISDNAITTPKIVTNAITSDKVTAGAIIADKIAVNAVTTAKISAGAIETDKIATNAVTSEKITANAITAGKIAANAVTATNIEAGSVTADKIAVNAITTEKILAGSVTADKINTNNLTVRDSSGKLLLGSGGLTMQGLSSNLLRSSGFEDGIAGYSIAYYTTASAPNVGWNLNAQYSLNGSGLAYVVVAGSPAVGQVFDFGDITSTRHVPVIPGARYEAHVLLNTHSCGGQIVIAWLNSAKNYISESGGNTVTQQSEVYDLTHMGQSGVFAVAPLDARYCIVVARGQGLGQADPYLFIKNMYFGQATVAQLDYTSYSPGRGLGQITTDNVSTYIANTAIDTAQIKNLAVDFFKIKGEAVSTTRYNVFNYATLAPTTLTTLSTYNATIPQSGDYIIIISISRAQFVSGFSFGPSYVEQEFELLVDGVRSVYSFIGGGGAVAYNVAAVNFGTRVETLAAGNHTFEFKYRYQGVNCNTTGSGITQARIYLFGAYK
jgi:hypothetical protein